MHLESEGSRLMSLLLIRRRRLMSLLLIREEGLIILSLREGHREAVVFWIVTEA